jgi:iron complex outermembrane receptor protein
VSARFEATYLDSVTFSAINNQYDTAEARWLMGARVSLNNIQVGDSGALRISAWGKNLADEEYREWGIDFGSLGYAGNVYGMPRSYGIDVVYTFGE